MVNTQRFFTTARTLHLETLNSLWDAFILCWSTVYTGFVDDVRVDKGTIFISQKCKDIVQNLGIYQKLSGFESHNSIATGEN